MTSWNQQKKPMQCTWPKPLSYHVVLFLTFLQQEIQDPQKTPTQFLLTSGHNTEI